VIRGDPDLYVFSDSKREGREIHLSKDLVLVRYRSSGHTSLAFTPTPTLDWPLAVGNRGGVTGRFQAQYGEPYDADLQWVVDAYEDVTVPAGTYKAFRITHRISARESTNFARQLTMGPRTWNLRLWYAPEARRFIKADGDSWALHFDLIALDPAESEPLRIDVQEPSDHAHPTAEREFSATYDFGVGEIFPLLTSRVVSGKGVSRVVVALNGEIVLEEQARGEPKRIVLLHVPLRLRDGRNVVSITASDPGGSTSQEARTVFYAAPLTLGWAAFESPLRVDRQFVRLNVPVPAAHGDVISWVSLTRPGWDWLKSNPVMW
jgi:hypothetical protein